MRITPARSLAAGLCVATLALAGCGSDDKADTTTTTAAAKTTTTTAAASAELEITDVWARQSPMATTAGAIYLTVTSPDDDQLVKASVPTTVAAKTEIHETVMTSSEGMTSTTMAGGMSTTTTAGGMMTTTTAADGMTTTTTGDTMTMRPVASIELPAGEAVELKPGGYHIMLLDLVAPLKVGDKIELTLTFEKAGEKTVTATVREG